MKWLIFLLIVMGGNLPASGQEKPPAPSPSDTLVVRKLLDSAEGLRKKGQYDSSLVVAGQALEKARNSRDSIRMAKSLNNIGLIYYNKGDLVKSYFHFEQALNILREVRNQDLIHTSLLNLGIIYKEQAIYDKALKYLFEAALHFERKGDLISLSSAYNTIGNILREEGSYAKSLEYHSLALKYREEVGYEDGIASSLDNIGSVYMTQNKLDSALVYFEEALRRKKASTSPGKLANVLSHIGELHYRKGNYALAEQFYQDAFNILTKVNNKDGITRVLFDLGQLYYTQKKLPVAEQTLLKTLNSSLENGVSGITLKCYDLLKKIKKEQHDFVKALYYSDLYKDLNKQILGEEKQKALLQMQVKYETEKKERELLQLQQENEKNRAILMYKDLQIETQNQYNLFFIIALVLVTIAAVLLYLLFKNKQQFSERLDMVMRELHHRVKNNFQVLLSLFKLQEGTITDEQSRELIAGNSSRIRAMMLIHQGLYFDKDITKIKIGTYIHTLINSLLSVYGFYAQNLNITYRMDETLDLSVEKSIPLGLLLNELVTNALKYAYGPGNTHPELLIELYHSNGNYHLTVEDNGPGKTLDPSKKSFGLKLTENQVKQLKGNLSEEKGENGGLRYTLVFPF